MNTTTNTKVRLNVNIDRELKQEAAKVLTSVGLDFTTAIHAYFNQIVNEQGIPFKFSAKRYYTPEEVMGENWRDGLDEIEDEWE